jgi:SAM-dependent methyltransferase
MRALLNEQDQMSLLRSAARRLVQFAIFLAAAPVAAQSWAWDDGTVPFVVTPDEVVERMLRIAEVGPGDRLIDLGSGDGRIVIRAAQKYGARGTGIEIDPSLIARSVASAQAAGVASRVDFLAQDLFDADLSRASVITMYLLPEVNLKLRPRLLALAPGTRIVSHDWDMGDWQADETQELRVPEKSTGRDGRAKISLWLVPADAHGRWVSELGEHGGRWEFRIGQKYQQLEVEAQVQGHDVVVRASRLRGREISLAITAAVAARGWNHLFRGEIDGDALRGEVQVSDGESTRRLPWAARRQP